ncbi:nuclear transport factor 2 family protein [Saccharopolyspora sp. NPDC003752]
MVEADNERMFRRFVAAMNRGDQEEVLRVWSPEMVHHGRFGIPGSGPEMPGGAVCNAVMPVGTATPWRSKTSQAGGAASVARSNRAIPMACASA